MTTAELEPLNYWTTLPPAERDALLAEATDEEADELAGILRWLDADATPGGLAAWLTEGREMQAPHLDLIDQALTEAGEHDDRRILLTMPPRHGKSRRAARWGPLWYLRRHPDRRVVIASYSGALAEDHGRWMRDLIEEHPEAGLDLKASSHAANRWDIAGGEGGLITVGVGGSLTGRGAHLLIVDDPVKDAEQADSPTYRRRAWEWWQAVVETRLEPGGSVVVIQTRWHEDDLAGRILTLAETDEWRHIDLPATAIVDEHQADELGRPPGGPLWPERYDELRLARIRRRVGERVWASLYQQRPRPLEGGVWRWEWIEKGRVVAPQVPTLERTVVAVDPAVSAGTGSDETGIVAVGRGMPPGVHNPETLPTRPEPHAYVLADVSGRYTPAEWGRRVCLLAMQLGADSIVIEDNQGGDMTAYVIRQAWAELARDRQTRGMCPAIKQVKSKDGKRLRAEPVAQLYEQGRGHHVGVYGDLEDQMAGWLPGGDSADDRLDALVHGATELFGAGSTEVRQARPRDKRLTGRR